MNKSAPLEREKRRVSYFKVPKTKLQMAWVQAPPCSPRLINATGSTTTYKWSVHGGLSRLLFQGSRWPVYLSTIPTTACAGSAKTQSHSLQKFTATGMSPIPILPEAGITRMCPIRRWLKSSMQAWCPVFKMVIKAAHMARLSLFEVTVTTIHSSS